MPLIILGLIVLIFLLIYAVAHYMAGDDRGRGTDFDPGDTYDAAGETERKALMFPTENVETEKHKRNIH